ncbi:hypothetical protein ACIBQX_49055 [Nonomuraea sp. NPDC049714]|uniref:hypothetical protein n=1 Tax=Nonomuraea sp. NPDC049714 TaxID=3364357 RepID=UPI0037B1A526
MAEDPNVALDNYLERTTASALDSLASMIDIEGRLRELHQRRAATQDKNDARSSSPPDATQISSSPMLGTVNTSDLNRFA